VAQRNREADIVIETIKAYPHCYKWLIMGDFNALSPRDSLNYLDGKLLDAYKKSDLKYESHNNIPAGSLDYCVIGKFLNAGFIDALYYKNKNEDLSSRPTKTNPNAVQSRIDYVFVSKNMAKKILYTKTIKDDFTNHYSDHYPVLVEFK